MTDNKQEPQQDASYFAAKSAEDAASILMKKSASFFNTLQANAYLDKVRKMWEAYHGIYGQSGTNSTHQISFSGEQGELVQLPVNHFRNLAQHMFNMVTTNRPVMEARAINTDYKSLAQTYLANGVLDYYMREKKLEDCLKKAVEMAIVLGSGYVKLEWNATAGEEYDADTESGEMQYEGEIEFSNLSPLDVCFDGTKDGWQQDWVLCRSKQNRYDLMAKYPEKTEVLKAIPSVSDTSFSGITLFSNDDTDDVFVYEFFHKRSEAMPNGRYLLYVSENGVLLDSPLPYRQLPVFRIASADIMGTPYAYTPMMDIYPIQEAINATYSAIATNQNAFAVQNLFVPRGADIEINSLEGSMNIIEGNSKPEPLNLTQTPQEVFAFLKMLIEAAETISGVNSVSRGNPEASLKSGTALALVQSMSLQFISGLQQSYVHLVEDVGTALISILKDFAMTPKVIALVGKNNRPLLKEFTGDAISAINRVVVDVGNPLAKTIAGRVQMAEQMMQMKVISNPQQYFQVLNTGRIDVAFEGEANELLLIKLENERMMEGDNPLVSPLDKHSQHIMEHRAVLADPDLRTNPELVHMVMDHIQAHVDALRNVDPALLQMINETPLPPAAPPQDPNAPPPGAGGPPPGQGAPAPQPPPQNAPPPQMAPHGSHGHNGQPQAQDGHQGKSIQGPAGKENLPSMPKPPAPFQHMPVTADQKIPQ